MKGHEHLSYIFNICIRFFSSVRCNQNCSGTQFVRENQIKFAKPIGIEFVFSVAVSSIINSTFKISNSMLITTRHILIRDIFIIHNKIKNKKHETNAQLS